MEKFEGIARPASSFSDIPTKPIPNLHCLNPKCFRAMAAIWPTSGWRSMWVSFETFSGNIAVQLGRDDLSRQDVVGDDDAEISVALKRP